MIMTFGHMFFFQCNFFSILQSAVGAGTTRQRTTHQPVPDDGQLINPPKMGQLINPPKMGQLIIITSSTPLPFFFKEFSRIS
jgi:hypothetical protein